LSFRKEKKYLVNNFQFHELKNNLLKIGMLNLYDKRQINSIYFDSMDYKMFHDSEEGVLARKKIRIRWYNSTNKYSYEEKISSIEGRYKKVKVLNDISRTDQILKHRPIDQSYGSLYPSIKVTYERTYYLLNDMRITFDRNIIYKNLCNDNQVEYRDPKCVVEIKVPINMSDDYIKKHMPQPTSRFSKYCRGVLISTQRISEF
jgi:hypothetical protein